MNRYVTFVLVTLMVPGFGLSHGDIDDSESVQTQTQNAKDEDGWETLSSEPSKELLKKINASYLREVKPILKIKCLNCHGSGNKMPWYYILPGPKQLMDGDIEEAKEHMDMSNDFPFMGHGSPKEDLEAIARTLREDTMPPWQYLIMHWSSSLTAKEKKIINKWTTNGIKLIKGGQE